MAPRLSTGEFSYVLSSGWYHERTVEYGSSPYDSFRGLPEHCPERKGALADARSGEKRGAVGRPAPPKDSPGRVTAR